MLFWIALLLLVTVATWIVYILATGIAMIIHKTIKRRHCLQDKWHKLCTENKELYNWHLSRRGDSDDIEGN